MATPQANWTTTRDDIRAWLKAAPKDATHMVVVTDTFSYEDYPVYVKPGQKVQDVVNDYSDAQKMSKVMEVYNLSMDIEEQIAATRVWNL